MTVNLFENDLFELHGQKYRFLGLQDNFAKVIQYGVRKPLPCLWKLERLHSKLPRDSIRVLPPPDINTAASKNPKNVAVAALRWSRIEGIVNEPGLFHPSTRGGILSSHSQKIGVPKETLLANLRLWWLGGQTRGALTGSYHRCGRITGDTEGSHVVEVKGQRGTTITVFAPHTGKSRGRKPENGSYKAFPMTEAVRNKILKLVDTYYMADEIVSIRALADSVIEDEFCLRDERGNPLRDPETDDVILRPLGQRPSEYQVRWIARKAVAISSSVAKRTTKSNYENNHAPTTADVSADCKGPADVYEIDATVVDLWLVAKEGRKKIIGKATLYLVIDRKSRLIVGFYCSLESPSWCEARMAILSIAGDWKALCERYKIKYRPHEWPAAGAMSSRITGDRGEMICKPSSKLADEIDVSVTNPPARRPKGKCLVESGFITIQVPLKDNVPGYEPPSNFRSRSGKKYSKDACLTLDDLVHLLLKSVISHNRKPLLNYPLSAEQIYSSFVPSPINNWNHGIENLMGTPKRFPYKFLRDVLSPKGTATVFVDGINFKGCTYEFKEAFENDWMTRASVSGCFEVPIIYTENLVDSITVQDPYDQQKQYTAVLAPKAKHLAGYSFAEVKALAAAEKKLERANSELRKVIDVTTRHDFKVVVQPAQVAVKLATKGVRHGSRLNGASEVRQEEARARRQVAHHPEATHTFGLEVPDASTAEAAMSSPPVDQASQTAQTSNLDVVRSDFANDLSNLLDQI